jgi:hypothetical protein
MINNIDWNITTLRKQCKKKPFTVAFLKGEIASLSIDADSLQWQKNTGFPIRSGMTMGDWIVTRHSPGKRAR